MDNNLSNPLIKGSDSFNFFSYSFLDNEITVQSVIHLAPALLKLSSITPISPKISFSPTGKFGSLVSFVGKKIPISPLISKNK